MTDQQTTIRVLEAELRIAEDGRESCAQAAKAGSEVAVRWAAEWETVIRSTRRQLSIARRAR